MKSSIALAAALLAAGAPAFAANPLETVDVLFTPVDAPIEAFGIVTDGPRCLLELPPGEYRVNTWFNGHSRTTSAVIPASRGAPVRVSLGFPETSGNDALLVPISAHKEATP